MVAQEMQQTAYAAQCAYWLTGKAQASMAQVDSIIQEKRTEAETLNCAVSVRTDKPRVSYTAIDATHIRLCGDFRRPSPRINDSRDYWRSDQFPELREARPESGSHCFMIELRAAPSANITPTPDTSGEPFTVQH